MECIVGCDYEFKDKCCCATAAWHCKQPVTKAIDFGESVNYDEHKMLDGGYTGITALRSYFRKLHPDIEFDRPDDTDRYKLSLVCETLACYTLGIKLSIDIEEDHRTIDFGTEEDKKIWAEEYDRLLDSYCCEPKVIVRYEYEEEYEGTGCYAGKLDAFLDI